MSDVSEKDSVRPAWQRVTEGEQRLGVGLALIALIALQYFAPKKYAFEPTWVVPAIELAILVVLTIANPFRINRESTVLRFLGIVLVSLATFTTAWAVVRLSYHMVSGAEVNPVDLVRDGATIWLTNVLVFALWYWEVDRGGPAARANARQARPDFLFPQMTLPAELADKEWEPEFVDYLYVSFTNAAAFSPTDTMPMSRWAKLAMMLESAVSLVTVVLVIARAVNVLGGS